MSPASKPTKHQDRIHPPRLQLRFTEEDAYAIRTQLFKRTNDAHLKFHNHLVKDNNDQPLWELQFATKAKILSDAALAFREFNIQLALGINPARQEKKTRKKKHGKTKPRHI